MFFALSSRSPLTVIKECSMHQKDLSPIVILGPMECETDRLAAALESPRENRIGAYPFIEGFIGGCPAVVCRCYMGVVNSAAATALAIRAYQPRCVMIQGTAGAHNPALHQGDIVLGENLVHTGYFFTPHRDLGAGTDALAWELHGSEIVSVSPGDKTAVLHSDSRILDAAAAIANPSGGRVHRGTIGAADIWNRELDMIAHLHRDLGTDCEEMEGFGVAQVCAQLGVPCAVIRVISNSEWYPEETFDPSTGDVCQQFVLSLIQRLASTDNL